MRILCATGSQGLAQAAEGAGWLTWVKDPSELDKSVHHDVVVADLRDMGEQVARWLRHHRSGRRPPFLLICSSSQTELRDDALEAGAEDFLQAPVREEELKLRLQRLVSESPGKKPIVRLSGATVDLETRSLTREDGTTGRLSATESKLLHYLVRSDGRTLTREELLADVWGYDGKVKSRTVQVTIQRLRTKVEFDPGEPENILTVYGEGYRFSAAPRVAPIVPAEPAPKLLGPEGPTNVSPDGNRFVGRRGLMRDLATALGDHPIVTLVGPGGSGKTRLSREFSLSARGRFDGGVWFVDLSGASDLADVLHRVASVLVSSVDGEPADDRMIARLGRVLVAHGRVLIVFDNAESVPPGAAALAATWSALEPATVLVTSRQPMRVPGEYTIDVPPLPDGEALELLQDRMAPVGGAHGTTEVLLRLAKRLDGLPLAIELAASRTRAVSPAALLNRLDQSLAVLKDRQSRLPARHGSLTAMLQASFDALDLEEREAMVRASLFESGFSLELAESTLESEESEADEVLEALADRSLVTVRTLEDGDYRYQLLDTVRAHATSLLEERPGAEADAIRRAWAHGVKAWLAPRAAHKAHSEGGHVVSQLRREAHNVRAAFDLYERLGLDGASEMAELTAGVLHRNAPVEVTLDVAGRGIALAEAASERSRQVDLLLRRALAYQWAGRSTHARADRVRALELANDSGDARLMGLASVRLAISDRLDGELVSAVTRLKTALVMLREGRFASETDLAELELGITLRHTRQYTEALGHVTAVAARSRRSGDRRIEMLALGCAAVLFRAMGRLEDAKDHNRAALALARELGERRDEAVIQGNLGNLLTIQGQLPAARKELTAALEIQRSMGGERGSAFAHVSLATIGYMLGEVDEALEHFMAAKQGFRAVDYPRGEGYAWVKVGQVRHARGDLASAAQAYDHAEVLLVRGNATTLLKQLSLLRVSLQADAGDPDEAERQLAIIPVLEEEHHATVDMRRRAGLFIAAARARAAGRSGDRIGAERVSLMKTANP